MPSTRCAHQLDKLKRLQRFDALVAFIKTAKREQLSSKLHDVWATPQASIAEARLLLTLGANPESLYVEDYGEKALAEREESGSVCGKCSEKFRSFLQYAQAIYEEMFEQTPINIVRGRRTPEGRLLALCLDGGGMRGLVSVVCLLFASRRLLGDESLSEFFDWFLGTSTGSMLAMNIAKGLTLSEAFFAYWETKREIFLEVSPMSRLLGKAVETQTKNLDKVLLNEFPDSFTFNTFSKRLTVPALDISTQPGRLHVFKNYSYSCLSKDECLHDVKFRDAARASSAAPTYFLPYVMGSHKFVDGSLVANCPLNVLFKEYDLCHATGIQLAGVVSIGTGEPEPTERKYKPGKGLKGRAKHLAHLSELLLEQAVGHEQSALEAARDRCLAQKIPFVRVSPKGVSERIDQVDEAKLLDMIWKTLLHLVNNVAEVDRLGDLLFKLHAAPDEKKRRSNTIL